MWCAARRRARCERTPGALHQWRGTRVQFQPLVSVPHFARCRRKRASAESLLAAGSSPVPGNSQSLRPVRRGSDVLRPARLVDDDSSTFGGFHPPGRDAYGGGTDVGAGGVAGCLMSTCVMRAASGHAPLASAHHTKPSQRRVPTLMPPAIPSALNRARSLGRGPLDHVPARGSSRCAPPLHTHTVRDIIAVDDWPPVSRLPCARTLSRHRGRVATYATSRPCARCSSARRRRRRRMRAPRLPGSAAGPVRRASRCPRVTSPPA